MVGMNKEEVGGEGGGRFMIYFYPYPPSQRPPLFVLSRRKSWRATGPPNPSANSIIIILVEVLGDDRREK